MRAYPLYALLCAALAAAWPAGAANWRNVVSRTHVSDVLVDGDVIWLSYLGGGVARYDPRTGQAAYFTAAEGLIHNYVTAIGIDKDNLYFASRNGLAALPRAGGAFQQTVRMWGFARNDCADVAVDDEYVYVATLEGARRYDKSTTAKVFEAIPAEMGPPARLSPQVEDGWKVFVTPDGVVLDDLYSVTPAEGVIYWGGRGRLFASARGAEGWREVPVELPEMAAVRRVLPRPGKLVAATGEGTFEHDGESTRRASGPLGRADTRDAFAFAGLEYYATAEGLFVRRADGRPFKFAAGAGAVWKKSKDAAKRESTVWRVGVADGLPSIRCTALASWGEAVVVGTEDGVCTLEPATGEIRPLPVAKALPPGGVYCLADGGDKVWAATPNGLAAIGEGDFAVEKFNLPGGWNDVRDVALYEGEMLITSRAGVAAVAKDEARGKTFEFSRRCENGGKVEGLCAVKYKGRYFAGTSAGLVELDRDFKMVKTYLWAGRFDTGPVRALLPFGPLLLCATHGGGLAYIHVDLGHAKTIKSGEGISSDVLYSLAADEGHVYVGTFDKGVDVLDADLNFERNISWGDGLSHTDIWAAAATPPWLWLAIRGVGINAINLETGDVRRYYARYGLGEGYCRSLALLRTAGPTTRVAFGTASGVAVLEYDGEPPDFSADDYDRDYR